MSKFLEKIDSFGTKFHHFSISRDEEFMDLGKFLDEAKKNPEKHYVITVSNLQDRKVEQKVKDDGTDNLKVIDQIDFNNGSYCAENFILDDETKAAIGLFQQGYGSHYSNMHDPQAFYCGFVKFFQKAKSNGYL